MMGGLASSSGAFAIKAAAIGPDRCAWRPASSLKVSKIPNVEEPIRKANHDIVPGSPCARGSALLKEFSHFLFFARFCFQSHQKS